MEIKTIERANCFELVEKKSRFIANIYPITKKEEAEKMLQEIKKEHYTARHHCYAYRILENGMLLEKCSDDGEPSGTAGAPMLTLLQKQGICNVLAVVTRYFGGILLGTGGLVRAYSDATAEALRGSNIIEMVNGYEMELEIEYRDLELFKYYCKMKKIEISHVEYLNNIRIRIELEKNQKEELIETKNSLKFEIKKWRIVSGRYILRKC